MYRDTVKERTQRQTSLWAQKHIQSKYLEPYFQKSWNAA